MCMIPFQRSLRIERMGRVAYGPMLRLQELRHRAVREGDADDTLFLLEHDPVVTLGRNSHREHLLAQPSELRRAGIDFFETGRGGDVTYHGPGQIVGYPIFDLDCFFTDVHKYVRYLEEAIIRTIAEYGLIGVRKEGYTGVWLERQGKEQEFRKICAIGVHLSRWVTMHGFALNVNANLGYFDNIIPCGIRGKAVTSLNVELGKKEVDEAEVKGNLLKHFAVLFEAELKSVTV